jgi:hypothetical protein
MDLNIIISNRVISQANVNIDVDTIEMEIDFIQRLNAKSYVGNALHMHFELLNG